MLGSYLLLAYLCLVPSLRLRTSVARMIYASTVLSVRDRQRRRSYGSDGWGRDLKATGAANIGEWDE